MWNAISLVLDLNSWRRVHFLRRKPLHHEHLHKCCFILLWNSDIVSQPLPTGDLLFLSTLRAIIFFNQSLSTDFIQCKIYMFFLSLTIVIILGSIGWVWHGNRKLLSDMVILRFWIEDNIGQHDFWCQETRHFFLVNLMVPIP